MNLPFRRSLISFLFYFLAAGETIYPSASTQTLYPPRKPGIRYDKFNYDSHSRDVRLYSSTTSRGLQKQKLKFMDKRELQDALEYSNFAVADSEQNFNRLCPVEFKNHFQNLYSQHTWL
eukprot:GHVP01069453.1.p1 GENE.GHVP01069453.1~~GHVP01069453.1.p1  ORF type:complete len:119 (-),score=10.69 GHVP01069453.1:804-1160(-)